MNGTPWVMLQQQQTKKKPRILFSVVVQFNGVLGLEQLFFVTKFVCQKSTPYI